MKLNFKMNDGINQMDLSLEMSIEEMAESFKQNQETISLLCKGYSFIKEEIKSGEIKTLISCIKEIVPEITPETTSFETTIIEKEIKTPEESLLNKLRSTFSKA